MWTWQKIDQEEETVWEAIRDSGGQDETLKLHSNDSLRKEMGTLILPGKKRARAGRGRSTGGGAGAGCGRWSCRVPGPSAPVPSGRPGLRPKSPILGRPGTPLESWGPRGGSGRRC